MEEADGATGRTDGRDQDATGENTRSGHRSDHRVDIGGNAAGPVIAGSHNVVVDAQHGSSVTLLLGRDRPRPVRRDRVALLPRSQGELLGRDAEIRALADAIRTGGLVQLWGPPGVGKSTLLRHAARSLGPGPDGVLFLNAAHREVGDLAQEMFEACYDAQGYAPTGTELRRLMTGVRVTVYVDNADLPSEQLRELADAAPDATFVFAGRDRAILGDGTALGMKGLERAAARELLARELQRPLLESESAAADDLWQAAFGRPLLLLRAAGLARSKPSGDAVLPLPGAITELLPLLFEQLDTAATDALHLLATLGDAELDPAHIGALTDAPDPAALCARLADLGLVLSTERGYRCAPDAVAEFRQRHPRPFPADRLCEHFTGWLAQATTTPAEVADHGRALEVTAELAELAGRPDLAVQVARAASPLLTRSLRFGVWGRMLGRGWGAARNAGDRTAMAFFTHEEGIRSLLTGRRVISAVLLAEAVVLWRQLGDSHGADSALHAQQYAPGNPETAAPSPPEGGTAAGDHTTAGDHASTAQSPADGGSASSAPTPADGGSASTAGTPVGPDSGTPHSAADHMAQLAHGPGGDPATVAQAVQSGAGHAGGTAAGTAGGVPSGTAGSAGSAGTAGSASSAGSAGSAGSAATTAATTTATASSASAVTAVLAVAAVVAAVAIGTNAVEKIPESLGRQSQTPMTPPTPSAPATSPSRPDTDLAGVWNTGQGPTRIVASGPGSYTAKNPGCVPDSVRLTGTGGTYRGRLPLWSDLPESCTSLVGYGQVTITVSPSGSTARVTKTGPSGDASARCYNCGSETWTRASSS